MLIEFSVSNFRSFRERQTLSMVATPRLRKRENVFKPELTGEKFPDLLKVAVIYGPNASGKSNLLKALSVVRQIARREPSTRDIPLPVVPFRFDAELANQPSLFELHFIHSGMRYQFNLAVTSERIVGEKLLAFPKGRESPLYERQHTEQGETYSFGEQLENSLGEDILEAWRKLTPPRLLFIAQAVANSSEELTQLKAPFEWITESSRLLLNGMAGMAKAAQKLAGDDHLLAKTIASFLHEVDVPISDIRIEQPDKREVSLNALEQLTPPQSVQNITFLTHKTALGEAELTFEDESEGTKNLVGFCLPWLIKEVAINSGQLLIVDELDSSLHPKIVAALVEKHINDPKPSQLIFTTHDTHLMDAKLLRRDQFWITERDMNGATQLRSIHDFEGRDNEDIEKRYYEGRYRGLPLITRSQ
ncbi:ATP-binding protein [Rhodoferax sp. U2-2l]|uniref:AAA family ATPase n=1 Tax=Rhodoferax sp. U2-2l TaxID=2884000 RepID=UPI001D0B0369|nr:ATP-binding protein [Rhodoferax sp. U2-2l]MCB8746252.1 ATP-binding protein [Rhodoferax sp. U2-2l]